MGGHFPGLSGKAADRERRPGGFLKICIATPELIGLDKNGGIGTTYGNLALTLAAEGHEVTILYLRREFGPGTSEESVIGSYKKLGIQVLRLPNEAQSRLLCTEVASISYLAYRWLKERDFDVIHFPEWMGLGYYSTLAKHQGLAFLHSTIVVGLHSPYAWISTGNAELPEFVDTLGREFMERKSIAYADVLFSPTQYMISWAADQGWELPERSYVQPHILPEAFIKEVNPEAVTAKELVFFGRLQRLKGLVIFCDALDIIQKDGKCLPSVVTFLGRQVYLDGLTSEEYIRRRAQRWSFPIRVLSDLDRDSALAYLEEGGRLAIIPSLVESFSHAVQECCAMGIPFLAGSVGGIPEGINPEDRERVCFVPRPRDLARRLARALEEGVAPARSAIDFKANRRKWIEWYAPPERDQPSPESKGHAIADKPSGFPLVSVCLTTFNRPGLLSQALESLRRQDYPNFEVVLVDDGSDQSEAIALLDQLEPEFETKGWRIIRQENQWVGAARNTGARHARGQYLLLMDDDNYAEPNEISTFVRVAEYSGADILTCAMKFFSGSVAPSTWYQIPDRVFLPLGAAVDVGVLRNCFGDTNALVRRSTFEQLGGFTEDYGIGWLDYEFFARAVLQGARLETVPEELCWYRTQEGSMNRGTHRDSNILRCARPYLEALSPDIRSIVRLLQGYHHLVVEDRFPALQAQHGRLVAHANAIETALKEESVRAESLKTALREENDRVESLATALREENDRVKSIEEALAEERARGADLAAMNMSLQTELLRIRNFFSCRLETYLRRILSWDRYDTVYQVWKQCRKKRIEKHEALQFIRDSYGIRSFFALYPFYKTVKPFVKGTKFLVRILGPKEDLTNKTVRIDRVASRPEIKTGARPTFDPSKSTMLLISHEASQTGAPILAYNLLEKFAAKYNVLSVLLGPGSLKKAFTGISFETLGPFPAEMRNTHYIHEPIFQACLEFAPAFAVVNSMESRDALIPLSEAGVPSILLVHEFASLYHKLDMKFYAASAGQMVFPARLVWEDAVAALPQLATRAANIFPQGPSRIPKEWLDGETADDEEDRIAAVMRPFGRDENAFVIVGCGYLDVRKGIDLFISVAAALKQRSPSGRFRFVWVGKEYDDIFRYLNAQVHCCCLQETMKFLGQVNSLEPVFAMADAFLLSSRLDPFPNVAIDAMLAGLPVVCFSNCSGVAEMLSNHADLKRLVVPYSNASTAAEVIEQLRNDDSYRRTAGEAIRDLALSSFDMDRYVERLDQLAERASLITRQKEKDLTTLLQSGIFDAGYATPPDFSAPQDTYIKQFIGECAGFGGTRFPFPGFHPGIYRNEHPELNEPPFVNPLAHFVRSGHPKGPWLLNMIRPEHSPRPVTLRGKPPALHIHLHSADFISEILQSVLANQVRPDIFVTVPTEEGLHEVTETADKLCITIEDISVVPNRGRGIGPLLTLLGSRLVKHYDIIGHLHDDRSLLTATEVRQSFGRENLLGGKHAMMDTILERFDSSSELGLVFPCEPNMLGWTRNRLDAVTLLKRMGIETELPDEFFFPAGRMFWARTDAIMPLLRLNLSWNDYPPEPAASDGTILQAVERLLPILAQHRGYETAGTYVPGVTK